MKTEHRDVSQTEVTDFIREKRTNAYVQLRCGHVSWRVHGIRKGPVCSKCIYEILKVQSTYN